MGLAAVLLSASLAHGTPAAAASTPNLLANGDAEQQRCTDDWTAQTSVPGWRVVRGAASVLCYSAFEFAQTNPSLPSSPSPGRALFAAPGADSAMEQVVDVGAASGAIDAGSVAFNLSGWLGGWGDRPERATLTAIFLDAAGRATGVPVVIADAGAAARGGSTALVQREAEGHVPAGTRRIVVTVQFLSGMTSFQNAYADNIALRLSAAGGLDGLAPRIAAPPRARVPAFDHVYVVMMENTNYADVVHTNGASVTIDTGMPFLASLAQRGVLLTNLWQTYHPSDQNYVAMVAGDTFKHGPVYFPDYDLPADHLGDRLESQGRRWRGYAQNMKTACNLSSIGFGRRSYSPDDEPFVQFHDVVTDPARCAANVRPLGDFAAAIGTDSLPTFAWIAANDWWDGEGAWGDSYDITFSNARQDDFLHATFDPLLKSAAWRTSRSLLIVTWDEANGWGWPDNHVPTLLVASPGLLRAGAVIRGQASGYDLLRTIESALQLDGFDRFDRYARPLNEAFADGDSGDDAAGYLWPTEATATRGSIDDTFGKSTTPAAVEAGRPLTLIVPAGVDEAAYVNLEPLGQTPTASSVAYPFGSDRVTVAIPTDRLAPGIYGAWLRRGSEPPALAPLMAWVLPPSDVSASAPGVEIVGVPGDRGPTPGPALREGSNPIVRYCLAPGTTAANSWIGIFPAGTPVDQMTQAHANRIGYWLKTPGTGPAKQLCGEAEAYTSELAPGRNYRARLLQNQADGTSLPIGRSAGFSVIPALPKSEPKADRH